MEERFLGKRSQGGKNPPPNEWGKLRCLVKSSISPPPLSLILRKKLRYQVTKYPSNKLEISLIKQFIIKPMKKMRKGMHQWYIVPPKIFKKLILWPFSTISLVWKLKYW